MSYTAKVNAQSLQLYLGICATGRAVASSTTLDTVAFGTIYNPRPSITFQPSDVGMPIAIVGGGPVDADMPPTNFVQGSLFHTTIAAYVSPTQVTLAAAPTTGIFNTGFATVILFRPCPFASDVSDVPTAFQFNSSIAPGTNDTLQFSVTRSLGGNEINPYIARFGALQLGQPVYFLSSDPAVGGIFGGYIDTLTTSSMPGVPSTPYSWSAQCVSYAALARRRVVPPAIPQVFTDAADTVFRKIVLDYCTDDGVSVSTTSAPIISIAAAVGANIGQLLDQVASLASDDTVAWYWTVDPWRNFVFTTRTATAAPWDVADGSDLFAGDTPYQQSVVQSHNQMANIAYSVGNQTLLNTLNVSLVGNGVAVTFNLPSNVGSAPIITLNSASQTVGVLGVDVGKDWYWAQGSAVITQDSGGAVLGTSDTLLVTYSPLVQAVAQSPNVGSLQSLQAIEGTSAQYEHVSTVSSPITPTNLLSMAEAYELEYGQPATTCQLYTLRPGLAAGQLQNIALPEAGIPSGAYLIATVQMTIFNNVILWQYTAFGGANIGDSLTPLVQFINRQTATLQIITPQVPITSAGIPSTSGNFAAGTSGAGGHPPLSFPSPVTAGHMIVVVGWRTGLGAGVSASDTQGNTYHNVIEAQGSPSPNGVVILYAFATANGPCTVTCATPPTSSPLNIVIAEIAGIDPDNPVDTSASNQATPPTLTVANQNNVVVTAMCMDSSANVPTVISPEILLGYVLGGGPASDGAGALAIVTAGTFTSSLASAATDPFYASVSFNRRASTSPPTQTTNVQGNPLGTVTNSLGALTSGDPVIGHGGSDVSIGSKTGVTTEFVTSSGAGTNGEPALWLTSGDLGAGTTGQLVPPGGSTGQVLTKNSGSDGDTEWATGGSSSPLTTKGDIFGFSSTDARIPVGTDGQVLTSDSSAAVGVSWKTPAAGGGIGVTVYSGLAGVSLSGATVYFSIGGGALASGTEADVSALMESSGTITGFGAKLSAALGTTLTVNNSVVLTWRKNGSATAVTCTITNPSTSAGDIAHSFTYAPGDLLSIQAVFTGTISVAPVWVMDASIGAASSGGGGSLPTSGWSSVNGILYNDFLTPQLLSFFQPPNGGLNWGFVKQSLAGIPYDFSCSIRFTQNNMLNNNAGDIGVYLTDGTKLIGFEVLELANSTPSLRVERMNSVTSDNGTVAGPTGNIMPFSVFSLRIVNDGVNRTFYYWNAGAWTQFYQEASGSFLTETGVGVGGLSVSGNPVVYVTGEVISWSLN